MTDEDMIDISIPATQQPPHIRVAIMVAIRRAKLLQPELVNDQKALNKAATDLLIESGYVLYDSRIEPITDEQLEKDRALLAEVEQMEAACNDRV